MTVWRWNPASADAPTQLQVRTVALLPTPGDRLEEHAPLLQTFVPAVDAVLAPPQPVPLADLLAGRQPAGDRSRFDRILWLRDGETLLTNRNPAYLRELAQHPSHRWLLPVHYPLPTPDPNLVALSLLSLEPRLLAPGRAPGESQAQGYSFAALPVLAATPPPASEPAYAVDSRAWAVMHRALAPALQGHHAAAIDALTKLYSAVRAQPDVAALVLRNLVALHLTVGVPRKARRLLQQGQQELGTHPEIDLLAAYERLQAGSRAEATALLRTLIDAPATPARDRMHGGGCNTYRALTLHGVAMLSAGDQRRAVQDWATAYQLEPMFLPPLRLLAAQRLHADVVAELALHTYLGESPPEASTLLAQAYANSSDPGRLPSPLPPSSVATTAGAPPATAAPTHDVDLLWEGPFLTHSSLARVNRSLTAQLLGDGLTVSLLPTEPSSYRPPPADRLTPVYAHLWRPADHPRIRIRHRYPPDFRPQAGTRTVIYLPWELETLPRPWVQELQHLDEVWAYSGHVAYGIVAAGVPAHRVHVIPCGFDPECFHPGVTPAPPVQRSSLFLYVGGTIARKGYDLAVAAFLEAFGPDDDVALVIKDFGGQTFYREHSGLAELREIAASTAEQRRRILLLEDLLPDHALAQLYRSATCLVAPYRAEGFGLPILEALACGTPVIATSHGPAFEFCPPGAALFLSARPVPCGRNYGAHELTGPATWAETDPHELATHMRWIAAHPHEAAAMGAIGSAAVHERFTWQASAERIRDRLAALL